MTGFRRTFKVGSGEAKPADSLAETRRRSGVIPGVYAKHLAEFQFLWEQRKAALRSPEYALRDVARLQERIAAHLDGLLLGGEAAVPTLEAGLAGEDPQTVFAAAYVLLALRVPTAAQRVVEAFLHAEAEKLEALCQSLCHGAINLVEKPLREAVAWAPAPTAVAALEALAFHRKADPGIDRLVEFLQDENPQVRRAAWRIMAIVYSPGAGQGSGNRLRLSG
jgi:uncharacterized protein (TIGR02270 family)